MQTKKTNKQELLRGGDNVRESGLLLAAYRPEVPYITEPVGIDLWAIFWAGDSLEPDRLAIERAYVSGHVRATGDRRRHNREGKLQETLAFIEERVHRMLAMVKDTHPFSVQLDAIQLGVEEIGRWQRHEKWGVGQHDKKNDCRKNH